ncbi:MULTISPECIES: hypothetical protein [Streptomyces]|uniref:hypothetical protein n=1 Tax=Streptomyces TaxID=1883 RepID=UPI0028BEF970|nr:MULTISPECIES: hypothetical protein [Streptomyces]
MLTDALRRLPGGDGDGDDASFTAHALLAAVRADLVEHLVGERGQDPERLRAALAAHVRRVLGD